MTITPSPAPSFLVVDDSKVSRTMVTGLLRLRMPQARFEEAADGAAAVEQFQRQPAQVVVMDFNMPGINGIEAAERILAMAPDTTVILLTANAQSAVQSKADAAGVQFMRKPIKPELADQIVAMATAQAARKLVPAVPQTEKEPA
jgi:two-component system chemotaxis response regulator CheY